MRYVLVDWVNTEEGFRPNLPADCSFACLAGSSKDQSFGLFKVTDLSEEDAKKLQVHKVPDSLSVLLDSCRVFPPALAGAGRDLEALRPATKELFVEKLANLVRERLESQPDKPYILARSQICEPGYRDAGEFVWVIAYRPDRAGREVSWVSSDFQIYSDAVETFDVEVAWLAARFGNKLT